MKKRLLTLVLMVLALTSAKASVVINSTNFPDENLRYWLLNAYGDGVLSDQELSDGWLFSAENVNNTKGLELLTGLTSLGLSGVEATATTSSRRSSSTSAPKFQRYGPGTTS